MELTVSDLFWAYHLSPNMYRIPEEGKHKPSKFNLHIKV